MKQKKDLDKKIDEIRRRKEAEEGQQDKENPEVPKPLDSNTKPDEVNKDNEDLKVLKQEDDKLKDVNKADDQ